MWNKVSKADESFMINEATVFMADHDKYGKAMRDVIYKWENTIENSLTNKGVNRRSFLGQCAVFYKLQIPEYIVRKSWKLLTDKQRQLADNEAENTIKEWELWYMKKLMIISKNGKKDAIKKGYQMKLLFN